MEPESVEKEKSWGERWQEAQKERQCEFCGQTGQGFLFIVCCECEAAFHKLCLDPLKSQQWPEGLEWICPECDYLCAVCNDVEPPNYHEEQQVEWFECYECNKKFHAACLDDNDKFLVAADNDDDDNEDEEAEEEEEEKLVWMCPECLDEDEDTAQWAAEFIEHDMTKEPFSRSDCPCDTCQETNMIVDTWKETEPKNEVEQFIKAAIDKIEEPVNVETDEAQFLGAAQFCGAPSSSTDPQ